MDLLTVLLVVFVLMMLGVLPSWGWHHYGYYPSGFVLVVVVVLAVLLLRSRSRL